MSDLTRSDIAERLSRLAEDLLAFPAGAPCPWPLGRVFNELVKLVKRDLDKDPVMRTMRLLDEAVTESGLSTSNAAVGTVRAMIGQVLVAYEHGGRDSKPVRKNSGSPAKTRRAASS